MEAFIKDLYRQLEVELQNVRPDQNAVKGYNTKAELVESSILKIKEYLNGHPFEDKQSEILYFKNVASQFFKLQLFYTLQYNLERTRIASSDRETFDGYVKKKIHRIRKFLKRHKKLRIYYVLGETNKDQEYFVNTAPTKTKDFITVDRYYCKKSIILAKIMAYQEFLPVLLKEATVDQETSESAEPGVRVIKKNYEWNLTQADTAELFYPWVNLKCISVDGRFADLKDVVEIWRDVFNYKINNISDVQLHNKRRKKDKAPFLNAMLGAYLMADK